MASTSSGGQTASSSWKMRVLRSRSSGTHSITMLRRLELAHLLDPANPRRIALFSDSVRRHLAMSRSRDSAIASRLSAHAAAETSFRRTSRLTEAQAMATPCPIVPAPTMPTQRTLTRRLDELVSRDGPCCGTSRSAPPQGRRSISRSSASWRSSTASRLRKSASWFAWAPPGGLGDDLVHDARGATRSGAVIFMAVAASSAARGVPPEDRGAALGGDHGVDRVLEHVDPVAHGDRQRAPAAPLAGHDHDDRACGGRPSRAG